MTLIYMIFLVLIIISLVLVLDQLQGKNLKKWSYLSKKSRIEENA
jgi:ABC-type transport system involved in cytochrome bd biosynthesis fused ATPase/permease subunit